MNGSSVPQADVTENFKLDLFNQSKPVSARLIS
jgi:hypothetical protein